MSNGIWTAESSSARRVRYRLRESTTLSSALYGTLSRS
jgi:hypothetical protein